MAGKILDFLGKVGKSLESKQVKVGFVDGSNHPGSDVSMAQIAAWNEYGQPENNQPPRPFFRNAISEHSEEWADSVMRGVRAGVNTETVLQLVGEAIVGDVQNSISELMEPKLSDVTLHIRRTRKKFKNQSTKPLVDTGDMYGDVKFEVGDIENES